MCMTKKIAKRHGAFTLIEMIVVIAIILVIAALAAAFAPRVTDNQNLTRAVDNLQQWLLTAKMRAKRDGLATGIRFIQSPGDIATDPGLKLPTPVPTIFSQVQYIQQPEPLAGGWMSSAASPTGGSVLPPPPSAGVLFLNGSMLLQTPNATPLPVAPPVPPTISGGQVQIYNFDPTLSGIPSMNQWLVQIGDNLEINGGGVFAIAGVWTSMGLNTPGPVPVTTSPPWPAPGIPVTTLQLGGTAFYSSSLIINSPGTTNFRILRQPRLLIGEEPLTLPNNYAVNFGLIPGTTSNGSNVANGFSGAPEILFSPTGAVIGTNAGTSTILISVWDTTATVPDPNAVGIIGIQGRSGFMGAYSVSLSGNPFLFVQMARESGL